MKKLISLLLTVVMIFALAACGAKTEAPADTPAAAAPEATAPETKNLKIGITLSEHTHTTFIEMLETARAFAEENGIELIEQDGKSNTDTMIQALENFINAKCDAIILQNSYPEAFEPYIEEAVAAGILVLAYDTSSEAAQYNFISNQEIVGLAIGNMAGKWINENADGKGKVAVLAYDNFAFLKERADYIIQGIMEVAPESEVVARTNTATIADGYDVAETLRISNPEVNCYVSIIDAPSVGASNAYVDAGYDGVLGTFGSDATEEALNLLADETSFFEGSISMNLNKVMYQMIETCYNYYNNPDQLPESNSIYFEAFQVTRENYTEFMN